jgi:hypothetical protein
VHALPGHAIQGTPQDPLAATDSDFGELSPRELVSSARRYLAQADAHLHQSLPLFDQLVPRSPQ